MLNSFFSASVPWTFGSSLMKSLPGPHVGKPANEQIILPPVACNAEYAAFSVGRQADSGFLMFENIEGIWLRREVMTVLVLVSYTPHGVSRIVAHFDSYGSTKRPSLNGTKGSSKSVITIICAWLSCA